MGARVLSNLAAFAGTQILARLLAPEDFGLVAIAVTVTTIVSAFTELSVMAALIHLRDVEEDHFHTAWTLSLIRAWSSRSSSAPCPGPSRPSTATLA
jgi:PST family polysaccharide transporter